MQLKEVVASDVDGKKATDSHMYMVFEYLDHDLAGLINAGRMFSLPEINA